MRTLLVLMMLAAPAHAGLLQTTVSGPIDSTHIGNGWALPVSVRPGVGATATYYLNEVILETGLYTGPQMTYRSYELMTFNVGPITFSGSAVTTLQPSSLTVVARTQVLVDEASNLKKEVKIIFRDQEFTVPPNKLPIPRNRRSTGKTFTYVEQACPTSGIGCEQGIRIETDIDSVKTTLYPDGDSNLDGAFDRLDLVQVLRRGRYLKGAPAWWADGDWNADGGFDQADITLAVANYSRQALAARAVPEPSTLLLAALALLLGLCSARIDRCG